MKITDKIISIPPYISTTWEKVASLHTRGTDLVITLKDNTQIAIPHLSSNEIEEIFHAHTAFLEQYTIKHPKEQIPSQQEPIQLPFRLLFGTMESLTQALQHNPAYSDLPPLPQEIISKLEVLAKALPPDEVGNLLHPVAGCNCIYCQMARLLKRSGEHPAEEHIALPENSEEEVKEEDLRFEQWSVETIGDNMYKVSNKLDPQEHYSVYLGDPIGCTCGKPHCEHIVAVLRH